MSTISTPVSQLPVLISTLANEVVIKLENRLSLLNRAYVWVKDSIVEISANTDLRDDFDELETWGTPFVLNPGPPSVQEYPFSELMPNLLDPLTGSPYKTFNMATLDVLLWTDPPTNENRIQLSMTHYQDADRASTPVGGQPSEWYRFANTIGFNPPPNLNYQIQARILRYHPFNWVALQNTIVLLPIDWHECLIWGAVERGYMELQEFDKASNIHVLLHGDPKYPAKIGLMQGAKKRRKKEGFRRTGSLRPIVRGYGWGQYC